MYEYLNKQPVNRIPRLTGKLFTINTPKIPNIIRHLQLRSGDTCNIAIHHAKITMDFQ